MNYSFRTWLMPLTCLILTACGDKAELADGQRRGDALTDEDFETYDRVAFSDLEKADKADESQCGVLRFKVWSQKQYLRTTKEWRTVSQTDAWKNLLDDHKQFDELECHWDSSEPVGCADVLNTLRADWTKVTEQSEWETLIKQQSYRKLFDLLADAKNAGCYKLNTLDADAIKTNLRSAVQVSDEDIVTYDRVAFNDVEKGDKAGQSQCTILRLKVWTQKQYLRTTKEWRTLGQTAEWQKLLDDHKQFDHVGCAWGSTEPPGCDDIVTRVRDDWGLVTALSEWETLTKQRSYKRLYELLADATQAGCYKFEAGTAEE